jgi:hypothetical protein
MFRFLVLWLCFVGAHYTALALSPADTTQSNTQHDTTSTITTKDTTTKDTKRIAVRIYMSASSAMRTNLRTVGLPEQFSTQFGNAPVAGVGIGILYWGDLLFRTSKLRTVLTLGKSLNVYPSAKLFANSYVECQIGYAVWETPTLKAYPFIGYGFSDFWLDSVSRLLAFSGEAGVGVDYFLPNTPLVVTLQVGYNHAFNRNAAMGTANNQPGIAVRTGISIFLFDRQAAFGF